MTSRALLFSLIVAMVVACVAYAAAWHYALRASDTRLDQSLILASYSVESEIARFRALPDVVTEDARIARALSAAASPEAISEANHYLQIISARAGANQLYLLDGTGTVIAASNWDTKDSFVGQNYAFRPYFKDAMADGRGQFYAIGVTTGVPGYFLSTRVGNASAPGVVVAKISLASLERTWRRAASATAVADRTGVVFLSGVAGWKYHPLQPLSPDTLAAIAARRTYDGEDIPRLKPIALAQGPAALTLPGPAGGTLRGRMIPLGPSGWRVISAEPMAPLRNGALLWAFGASLVAMAMTAIAMVLNQRRQLIQLRLRQGEVLEARVRERTQELAHEVEARRRTEADLRAAQETMIHTEKMAALGRMSAAIVHELSQPLAAMEATLAATELSSDPGETSTRIGKVRGLVRRMQRTTKHLKSFSRKEQNTLTLTDLNAVARNALELVAPRAKAGGIVPEVNADAEPVVALAGPVRLEQVCLNLLLNAFDAVEGQAGPSIVLAIVRVGDEARLSVTDNGAGIPTENLSRVSEPFFSTKVSGDGLGLGLSVSQAILEEFGGRLEIVSTEGEGTCVAMVLPVARAMETAAQ
ncbi:sensor histidine kinase [Solirhodobacter olei]|uniref:sensor histidine kinase n=1 Tax=Solirhodobacter olei TaxID=2493082 RepID=UPI001F4DA95D|nr:ATP-binding protein [Solirhodobacter olei]